MAGSFLGTCVFSLFGAGIIVLFVTAFPVIQITLGAFYVYECPAAPAIPVYVMVSGIWALLLMGLLALPKLSLAAAGHIMWTVCLLVLVLFSFIWFIFGSYHIYSVHPPNYTKNTTISNSSAHSSYAPAAPDNRLSPDSEKESLPTLNLTRLLSTNQTLMKLIQTAALSGITDQTIRKQPGARRGQRVEAAAPYCNKTVYLFAFWTTTLVYALAGNALLIFICVFGFVRCLNWVVEHGTF